MHASFVFGFWRRIEPDHRPCGDCRSIPLIEFAAFLSESLLVTTAASTDDRLDTDELLAAADVVAVAVRPPMMAEGGVELSTSSWLRWEGCWCEWAEL